VKEIGRSLASLGVVRFKKGSALNVRRREKLRRALAEAGQPLRWAEVAALSEDPIGVVSKDLTKLVRSGAKSLGRSASEELVEKKAEYVRLTKLQKTLEKMGGNAKAEYPYEVTYTRTARSPTEGYVVKTETLVLNDADEALRAARKMEKSLPGWAKLRDEAMDDLRRRKDTLESLDGSLGDLVESWRPVLKEVLITIR
jgi:hypothetical protein